MGAAFDPVDAIDWFVFDRKRKKCPLLRGITRKGRHEKASLTHNVLAKDFFARLGQTNLGAVKIDQESEHPYLNLYKVNGAIDISRCA